MHPGLLDVNVHPAKLEVRLSKEQELMTWLEAECKKALQRERLIPEPWQDMKKRERKKTAQPTLDLRLPEQLPQKDRSRSQSDEVKFDRERRQEAEADHVREQEETFGQGADQDDGIARTADAEAGSGSVEPDTPPLPTSAAGGASEF
jgi:DNA mismatch repair protein MutL